MTKVEIDNEAVRRAVAAAVKHPHVGEVGSVVRHDDGGGASVEITFNVALPNEWRTAGESPKTGVRLEERVRFDFPRGFPLLAPVPSLRPDFSRSLPHTQPYTTVDGRPVPCIYDGDLAELLHHQGWRGLLDHTAVWLDRAATASLIDAEQGWEPVRRDCFRDYIIADASDIQQVVNRRGGMMFRRTFYLRMVLQSGAELVHSRISPKRTQVNKDKVPHIFEERPALPHRSAFVGNSLAILVWPGKHPSGDLVVNDTYLPETVSNVRGLRERAKQLGCLAELDNAFGILRKGFGHYKPLGPFKLLIVLLARRPFRIIGSTSEVEMCPYVVDVCSPDLFADGSSTAVFAAAHRHQISRDLLAQMAGKALLDVPREWTLLGAGSLGSKIAVHLARAGHGPRVVVDRSSLSPHNAARHALLPLADDSHCLWMHDKAVALCEALRGLSQQATPIVEDVVKMVRSQAGRRLGKKPWAVVNATASLTVQEALAATDALPTTRVVETSLFAGGRVGVVTVEGPDRSPNTADLMAECYRLLAADAQLAEVVFGEGGGSRQRVGQGCGSLTMAMSDGRLSLFAAAMAEYLLSRQRDGLPDNHGEVLLGRLLDDGLGLTWRSVDVGPTTTVPTESGKWRIRISQFAKRKIEEEVRRWQDVETGGVLIGRLSEPSRSARIVDVLSAPEDSVRSRSGFILGVKGLRPLIERYTMSVDGALYCVGTWHSHIVSSSPSLIDKETARLLSLVELSPSVLLIHTPSGFRGLLADVR